MNLRGWEPAQTTSAGDLPALPPTKNPLVRSPLMHASMPLMASTADAFVRQFYSPANIPQQRILPVKGGVGK